MKTIVLFLALCLAVSSLGGCCSTLCWFVPPDKDGVETPDTKVKKPGSSKQDPVTVKKTGQ